MAHSLAAALLIAGTWIALPGTARADEPCEEFLDALLARRYFDTAQEYLEAMSQSDLASEAFRRRIPMRKVEVLLLEASTFRDPDRVTEQLDRTQAILDEFVASSPPPDLLAEAQEQIANIALGRARRLLENAESDRLTVEQREDYRQKARDFLQSASTTFDQIRLRLRSEVENFQLDPEDPESINERKRLQNDYVKIRLKSPDVKEQIANSYGSSDPKFRELIQQAAVEYQEIYEDYRTRASGIDGAIGAARCYVRLGEPDRALGYLEEVFALERGETQNQKKREAALVALDIWAARDPYPYQEIVAHLEYIVKSMPPEYARSPEGLRLRMEYAKAAHAEALVIHENGADSPEVRRVMVERERDANSIMRSVARVAGAHREEALRLLEEWGNSVAILDPAETEMGPPETLADARQRGVDIQLAVADLKSRLRTREAELKEAAGTDREAELAAETEKLRQQIQEQSAQALNLFDLALSLAGKDAAADDISNIRYLQCLAWFQMDRWFEAAIIGEFLADRYPNGSGTRPAVELVCKSYWQLYLESRPREPGAGPPPDFELQQLQKYSEMIFNRWPDSVQAENVGLVMALLSLDRGDPEAAERYLEKIPEASPQRGPLLLQTGNQLWRQYVIDQRQGNASVAMRDKAREHLEKGVATLSVEGLSLYGARSALALTEVYLDAGDNDAALQQLEFATVAPLDLIKIKHPVAEDPDFRRDVFKTAIRTYLAKLRDGNDPLQWVGKSRGVLDAMRQEMGRQPEGREQLTGIYLTLSRELKQQFDTLESPEQRIAFADGLESFLRALAESADDRQMMLLTGTMLTDIGASLRQNNLNDKAARFYELAIGVYSEMGQEPDTDPRMQLAIERGRANAMRGVGRHEEAVKLFEEILARPENQRYSELQIDAAYAYTEWGLEKSDPEALVHAVQGSELQEGARAVMGWMQLARAARRSGDNALFAEAVYNIARCKFRYGEIRQDSEMQKAAVGELEQFQANVPDMGGPQWKPRVEELMAELKGKLK